MGLAAGVSLGSVRDALLAQARDEADRLEREAVARASAELADAEAHLEALVRRARAEGEEAAELEAATGLADARRRARSLVLDAQRSVYERVRAEAHAAAERLRSEPRYDTLVERLAERGRDRLGPGARIDRDPPGGGVIVSVGTRTLDYSLPALVELCLQRHGSELEELWT